MDVFTANTSPNLPSNWTVTPSCCAQEWASYSDELRVAAAEFGALLVWGATGRRYGVRERLVRPCRNEPYPGAAGWYWSDGFWLPYVYQGVWRNCWSGCADGCCSCRPRCQVWLEGPVAWVTTVTLDGVVLASGGNYRVDGGQWLVRTSDTECWPSCQDYDANTGAGTWSVAYGQGFVVPDVLARAAGEVACEYAKACLGATCRLPSRAVTVARQGVSMSYVDVDTLLDRGLTGITTVDQVITTINPYGSRRAPRLMSVDLPSPRETTWP